MKISLGPKALAIPSPVWVIGSYGTNEQPNIMIAAWGGVCCTEPPCIAISVKQTRATHVNIVEHSAFTISIPTQTHLAEVDYIGMVSGIAADKFSSTGLTAVRSTVVNAPYVQEFPLVLECKLLHQLDIGTHTQFIGQVLDSKADDSILSNDANPSAALINPLISSAGERAYYALGHYLEAVGLPGSDFLDSPLELES